MKKSRTGKQRGHRLRLEALESRRVLAAMVGLPTAAPTFEMLASTAESSVRQIAAVRAPHKFFANLSFDVTSNAKANTVVPGTILPGELSHRSDSLASVADPIRPIGALLPDVDVSESVPIAEPVTEIPSTPRESTLVVESIQGKESLEPVVAPPPVVVLTSVPVAIDSLSQTSEQLPTEILLGESVNLDFTDVNHDVSPTALLRDAIGFIAEDILELGSEPFDSGIDSGNYSLNDDSPELQRSESRDSNPDQGSHSIADDSDLTPRIDPEPTDLGDGDDSGSVVSGSVDIARSLVAGKLDQVSRHVLLSGNSNSFATPRLASVQPGLAETAQRAHRSTNASIAACRAMELARELSNETIALAAGLQTVDSMPQTRPSGMDRVGVADFDPVLLRMVPTETPLPLEEFPHTTTPDPASGDVSDELKERETPVRFSSRMEISNPLVSVTLLVMSCLGGLVISRNLDPDDDRSGPFFEHRL